ncbi:hypothetical protein U3516DRAFT_784205 [Neocallimastix sp. 'constans']
MKMKLCVLEINSMYALANENSSITVKENSLYLEGFQAYIVLDWVTDRSRLCKTIIVYTGNPNDRIHVCSINFLSPKREDYGQTIENLFKQYKIDKAKPKTLANNDVIMVTELISFPTSLSTLRLIDGDYESHKEKLYININLKKFGCGGRGILTLNEPSDAQKDKFYQLFDIHPSVPFNFAIIELGKIIQISLYFLGMIVETKCDDGLLCDETLTAIRRFYTTMSSYDTEIDSNLCSPALIKEIIRQIVDLKFKLHVLGYQSTKDPFQFPNNFERQIIAFKKNNNLKMSGEKSAELNESTIIKINEIYKNSIASSKHKYKSLNEKNDFSFYFQHINIDRLKYLLSGKKKNINENIKSMDNLKNIFSNSIMKLNDIKRNNSNSQAPQDIERLDRKIHDIYIKEDYYDYDEESNDIYSIENENETVENEIKNEENIQVSDNESIKQKDQELILSQIVYLNHSNSVIESRTRQKIEEIENIKLIDENENQNLKIDNYRNFIEENMLINKIKEYQKSKHNHSLNNRYLRKTKSYSDLYETRKSLENNDKIIKIGLKSYIAIEKVMNVEKQCKNSINNIKTNIKDYGSIIEKCREIYKKRSEESNKILMEINQINSNQSKLLSSLQDVDMFLSKQTYNISSIEEKLGDMEELISQFKNRISKLPAL